MWVGYCLTCSKPRFYPLYHKVPWVPVDWYSTLLSLESRVTLITTGHECPNNTNKKETSNSIMLNNCGKNVCPRLVLELKSFCHKFMWNLKKNLAHEFYIYFLYLVYYIKLFVQNNSSWNLWGENTGSLVQWFFF